MRIFQGKKKKVVTLKLIKVPQYRTIAIVPVKMLVQGNFEWKTLHFD